MTSRHKLRSRLLTATLLLLAAATFAALAPTSIGGATSYVTTHGISMAPRFHTGDLAVVRRAGEYRVGDVVAYHSTILRTVVMHRIIARHGARYVFRGDNNDFVDPSPVTSGALIGKLWLRVPRAGGVSDQLHTPAITAVLIAAISALLLFVGTGRRRRRRDRRRGPTPSRQGALIVASSSPRVSAGQILTASAVAAVVFIGLGVLAATHPSTSAVTVATPYTEHVRFDYGAHARHSPVYPTGLATTGDTIFLRLAHRVRVRVDYRLVTAAPHRLTRTMRIAARLTSPSGWTRDVTLLSPTRFEGDAVSSEVTLDMTRLRALVDRAQTLTGSTTGGAYTLAIVPRVDLAGTLGGQPLTSDFGPQLSFAVDDLQMRPSGSTAPGVMGGFTPRRSRTVAVAASVPATLGDGGHALPVAVVRWIALVGTLLAAVGLVLGSLARLRGLADPNAQIQSRYEHLIVPISGIALDPHHPPIEVTSFGALAQLAERSERLILHHHRDDGDTYLIDDEGTLYRYQARPAGEPSVSSAGDPGFEAAAERHGRPAA
ncbi:MAG: signal peptidase [Solirubrobacteraceae bacterium]|jgi:signal peptidase I|nr:signal peptidase [Solirubrobacteraceae bacterium]